MRYRKLTNFGDYTFGNGQLDFYRDVPQAVGQAVQTSLRLWLGEWYLDTTLGVPYIEGVIGKHGKATADITLQDQILNVQGVLNIQTFSSTIDPIDRKYTVSTTINTIYGVTEVQIKNYANF